jgi:glutamate-1-semialdehyde 2,1-aminomutase
MEMVAPSGPVYQAGTLSGNPLAMTAGIVTLDVLKQPGAWKKLENAALQLERGIYEASCEASIPVQQTRVGTMFTTFFFDHPVRDWPTVKVSDTARYGQFFRGMLEHGVYLAPSQFEAGFVSTEHTPEVIAATVEAAKVSFRNLK